MAGRPAIRKVKLYNTLDQKADDLKNMNTFLVDPEEKWLANTSQFRFLLEMSHNLPKEKKNPRKKSGQPPW